MYIKNIVSALGRIGVIAWLTVPNLRAQEGMVKEAPQVPSTLRQDADFRLFVDGHPLDLERWQEIRENIENMSSEDHRITVEVRSLAGDNFGFETTKLKRFWPSKYKARVHGFSVSSSLASMAPVGEGSAYQKFPAQTAFRVGYLRLFGRWGLVADVYTGNTTSSLENPDGDFHLWFLSRTGARAGLMNRFASPWRWGYVASHFWLSSGFAGELNIVGNTSQLNEVTAKTEVGDPIPQLEASGAYKGVFTSGAFVSAGWDWPIFDDLWLSPVLDATWSYEHPNWDQYYLYTEVGLMLRAFW